MPMDRFQLKQVIDAGRSSALNCLAIGNTIPDNDPTGKMFRNDTLNGAMFCKVMEQITSLHHTISIVQTLIYFPYNHDNIYEGGDSILYDDPAFHRLMQVKTSVDTKTRQGQIDYVMDLELIEMIHSLPSLDPFLFKSKAEQLDLLDRIHSNYFDIDETEWEAIRAPIRQKILKLVRSAFNSDGGVAASESQLDRHAEKFLDKIWEARDIYGVEEFVSAMNITPHKAPALFFAWKAICYFQTQFEKNQREIGEFFSWIGDDFLTRPIDHRRLSASQRMRMEAKRQALKERMVSSYQKVVRILQEYEGSYRHFIENGEPQKFKDFLASSEFHYQEVAACLSAMTHATQMWREIVERGSGRLNSTHFDNLLNSLCVLFDAKVHTTEQRVAS